MRIAFYLHHSHLKAGGIFTYSIGVLKLLISSDKIDTIFLIYSPETENLVRDILNNPKIIPVKVNPSKFTVKFRLVISYFLHDNYLLLNNYLKTKNKLKLLLRLAAILNPYSGRLKKLKADIFHVPLQYSPVYAVNIPVITTQHDFQELYFPEFFTPGERIHRAINQKKAIDYSDSIIVSFKHVKDDLKKFYRIEEEKIFICPPPFSESWFVSEKETNLNELKYKYQLFDDFILYPAATWQHKNHLMLIKALLKIRNESKKEIKLICTGHMTDFYKTIEVEISKVGLQNNIRFLGIIPEADLAGLYKLARLVVIPTLYEAGSGPLFEAMRYNCPVIVSDVTSLPDSIGNSEFIFNPKKLEQLSQLILKGLFDEDFRKRNVENSKKRIQEFRNFDYVLPFINAYKNCLKLKTRKKI